MKRSPLGREPGRGRLAGVRPGEGALRSRFFSGGPCRQSDGVPAHALFAPPSTIRSTTAKDVWSS
jgi:hypothetical protein